MATPAYRMKYTYEDYLLFPEDGSRHELIGGEHYVAPAPNRKHQWIAGNLHFELRSLLAENPLGHVYFAPLDVVLSDWDVVQPDLLFISNERSAIEQDRGAFGPPDLVIEILSDSTRRRDETLKLDLYSRMGVREYWLFDPELETTSVFRPSGNGLALVAELSAAAGDCLETPLLPGLKLQLARIF
jgi:Uma2 family endonuclease